MPTKFDKTVRPGWAAKVLCIDYADLPKLDRPWTKRDVRELQHAHPGWLTEARRRYAAGQEAKAVARAADLDTALTRLGYTAPDEGTVDQAVLYIDQAMTHLMIETHCTDEEAEQAAWRRWPKSKTAEDLDVEHALTDDEWLG